MKKFLAFLVSIILVTAMPFSLASGSELAALTTEQLEYLRLLPAIV